jgi:hypothetical protein
MEAVQVFARLLLDDYRLYLTEESVHVLQLRRPQYANAILKDTEALRKGRYLRRWARRVPPAIVLSEW